MRLTIPKTHRAAFLRFVRLSPEARRTFIASIKRAKPSPSLRDLARQLPLEPIGLSSEATCSIIRCFASMFRARSDAGIPAGQFSADLVNAAKAEATALPELQKTNWPAFKRDVITLIQSELPLALTAKASELASENAHRLCPANCRVISDMRPVFTGDPKKNPSAVLIQHTLKIAYHAEGSGSEVKEFYVAMDEADIMYLQTLLGRACDKEKSLRRVLGNTSIPVLSQKDSE